MLYFSVDDMATNANENTNTNIVSINVNPIRNTNANNLPLLRLRVDPNNPTLLDLYKNHVEKHNSGILRDPYPNAGFDLFVPSSATISPVGSTMVSMDVQCEMILPVSREPTGYYLYPRSSISKTPLMLANQVGIIDSGYRGNIIGAFRAIGTTEKYGIEPHTRLLQICAPSLQPFLVELVNELSNTERGAGGFGSTGV